MSAITLKRKLRHLLCQLRHRASEYGDTSAQRDVFGHTRLEANRYEGISTASRWSAEDLEKILKERAPRKKQKKQ